MDTKSFTRRLAIALAVASGLTLASLAQAQDVYYWLNFDPPWPTPGSALYSNWSDWPNNPSEVNFNIIYNGNFATSGMEVTSTVGGYGSGYADLNGGVGVTFANGDTALATNDTLCLLTFTVNPTPSMTGPMFYTNYNWMGIQFIFNLDSGIYSPPVPYCGWNNPGNSNGVVWTGSNVTIAVDMTSFQNFTTYTVGGTNHFYGMNLGVAPSVIHNDPNGSSGPPYDITFNTITFAALPTTPPNPCISFVGGNVVVSWPDPNNIYTLYQSADLTALFSWSPWGYAPVWNNGTNTVVIQPPFSQALFFRLGNSNLQ